jgi:hypothetical protein
MEVQNEATGKVFTIEVRVVKDDNFAHLGARKEKCTSLEDTQPT